MKRIFAVLAFLALTAAADKPLVMESAKIKQLPASTTLQINASGTGAASINIPHGTAPSSPNNGDCWTTTSGLFCRINGSTVSYGGGSGTVTTTGSPASGNLTKFSGSSSITNGDLSGDVTTSGTLATTIANSAVTLSKIANASANSKLVGSGASGSGSAYSEITLGTGLTMTGTTLSATGGSTPNALTITSSGGASPGATFDGSAAKTIDYSTVGAAKTGAVTSSNLTMSTARVLGRTTASTGAIEEIQIGSNLSLSSGVLSATGAGGSGSASWALACTTSSVSAVAQYDCTSLGTYNEALIIARNLTTTVSGVRMVQVSTGAVFDSTVANYQQVSQLGVESNADAAAICYHGTAATAARDVVCHVKNMKGAVKLADPFNYVSNRGPIMYVGSASDIDGFRITNNNGGTISGGPIYVFVR